MTQKPEVLILYYDLWRCGLAGENQLGEGRTELLNPRGYMCCLGQFEIQMGVPRNRILGIANPEDTYEDNFLVYNGEDSVFSGDAMRINDNPDTTPSQKIELLTALCQKEGIELVVLKD